MLSESEQELVEAWDLLSVGLRMKRGLDQQSYNRLTGALRRLKNDWSGRSEIPREAVIALVDIVPGMEALAPLYEESESGRIHECKYELQDLIWDCLWGAD